MERRGEDGRSGGKVEGPGRVSSAQHLSWTVCAGGFLPRLCLENGLRGVEESWRF